MEKSKKIYMDFASATPVDKSVLVEMDKTLKDDFGNPSALHELGVRSKQVLEASRTKISVVLGAHNDEIIFTSGATESNNLAILGLILKPIDFVPHIITTNIEHSSVLEVCRYLEKTKKAEVSYLEVEKNGIVDPKKIKKAIKSNTVLISVMYANNEIGTVEPIEEIAKVIRHYKKENPNQKIFFHTDATQAINYLPIKVDKLGVDLMSFNAGKIYGPKGVGVLYIKRKTPITKILFGGNQENDIRPGTENIVSIVGLATALQITEKMKEKERERVLALRDYFIEKLFKILPNARLNGDRSMRLPNNINISIPKIPSDLLVIGLSAKGIYVSEKSACKSHEKAGSYVLQAISENPKICKKEGSIRFSLGRQTTKKDIDYVLKSFSEILTKLKKWYN